MGQEETTIKKINQLTPREREVTELIAWGSSKKEVAEHLLISERTVENHSRNIYEKTGCQKANELSAWWFCNKFGISFSLAPSICRLCAMCLLSLFVSTNVLVYNNDTQARRVRCSRTQTSRTARRSRRGKELTLIFN